jgi:DNA-binding LacI/PurR family transcriptional regulator
VDSEDKLFRREQLADDLVLGRLAGVIFASNPFYLGKSFFTDLPDYPYISIQARSNKNALPTLTLYDDDVLTPSLKALRARGVQRLAVLVSTSVLPPVFEKILRVAKELGFTVEPQWLQAASLKVPSWAANAVQLLLSLPSAQRPEAILVQDDTLLPFVLSGIEASPVSLERDVQILAMCNFPTEIPSHRNILRCGPDLHRGLAMMVKHLTNQRLERRQPRIISLPPRCEWESTTNG